MEGKYFYAAINKTMIHADAVTLKQLRALAAIVRSGNFSAAAEALRVTGPAVSTQLRALEANLGTRLLERGPNGRVSLTPAGEEVLAAATQVESALSLCLEKVNALNSGLQGHVSMGVVSTGKYFAPRLVAQVRAELPSIRIGLRIGNRGEIIQALSNREIEIAIMGRPPREPAVEADPLGDHPHLLIAPPDHPLVGACDISPDALLAQTFLTRELGSGTRILMERFLDRFGGGRVYEQIEMGSNETIKQAVMAGLGIAVISAHTVTAELEAGRLATIRVPGMPIMRKWFLVRRSDAPLPAAAARLREFILSLHGGYLPALPESVLSR